MRRGRAQASLLRLVLPTTRSRANPLLVLRLTVPRRVQAQRASAASGGGGKALQWPRSRGHCLVQRSDSRCG